MKQELVIWLADLPQDCQAINLFWFGLPSGKRLHSELENHHTVNGKTHSFYGHFQLLF
jgi:hypothetical protein